MKKTVGVGDYVDNVWKPEPGDQLVGEIVRKDEVTSQFGLVGILEVDDAGSGVVTIFCGTAQLKRIYADVNQGETLDITYEGERTSEKSGRTFKSYRAEVDDGQL